VVRPRRITRYVLRELAAPTLLGLLLYTFVLLMNHFFLVAEQALSKNLGFELTLRLFAAGIPKLLVLSIPMAVLLGSLIAMGRLSADHEWVALQATGQGPRVLLVPLALHGLLGTLACLWVYSVVVPRSNYVLSHLRGEVFASSNPAADLRPRVFFEGAQNAVLFVNEIRPGGDRRLEGVLCIQADKETGFTQIVLARHGDLYPAGDGTGAMLVDFFEGEVRRYVPEDGEKKYYYLTFAELKGQRLEAPAFLRNLLKPPDKSSQDMTLPELWGQLRATRAELAAIGAGAAAGRRLTVERRLRWALVEMHQRLALPLAALLFSVLALPLGITSARTGKGAGFALSVVVVVVYRAVYVLGRNQSVLGHLPPFVGPWIADVLILIWALWAFRRLRWAPASAGPGIRARLAARLGRRRTRPEPVIGPADAWVARAGQRLVGRIDRYVGWAFLRMLVLALASIYAIYTLVELQDLMDAVLRSGKSPTLILDYLKYFLPTVLRFALPIACLIAAVVTVALLSRTSELVAIQNAGMSMRRAMAPILLLTLGLCAVLFVVQDRIAPGSSRRAQATKDRIANRTPRTYGATAGQWIFGPEGRYLYHYRLHDPDREEFQALTALDVDWSAPRIVDHRFTSRAHWTPEGWEFSGGWRRSFDPARFGSSSFERSSQSFVSDIDMPRTLVSQRSRLMLQGDNLPDQLSLAELNQQIRSLQDSGFDITALRVAFHTRIAQAVAPLVMVLLGLPFAFRVGRRGSLYGIGVALLLVLVYWATFAVFRALGLETILSPIVAAWAPNVLYGLLGTHLLLYVRT